MELINTQCSSIPEIIRRAFKIALEEKVGAVQIELPQDIAKMDSR
jgi:acetolactate synthase I/II/III large subunit